MTTKPLGIKDIEWYREPGTYRWKWIGTSPEGDITGGYGEPPPGAIWKGEPGLFAIEPPTLPGLPSREAVLFSQEQARAEGFEMPEGWQIKITPIDGDFTQTLISPAGEELSFSEAFAKPEGKWLEPYFEFEYTPEAEAEYELMQVLFPEQITGDLQADLAAFRNYIERAPEAFYEDLSEIGWTKETEALLSVTFPGITDAELLDIFGEEGAGMPMTQMALQVWKETPWAAPAAPWGEAVKGFPGLMDIMEWLAPTKVGATLGVLATHLQKYAIIPWETMVLDARARFQLGLGMGTDADRAFLDTHYEIISKYGYPSAFFADEYHEAFQTYLKDTPEPLRSMISLTEWLNPVWFIPIGGTFGRAASFTSKVPVIGKSLRATAVGVQAVERGVVYPVTKPIALGLKGMERVGAKLGAATADRLRKQSQHLEVLMELPASEQILDGVLVDNWMRRVLQIAAKIPPVRVGIQKGLGWRILTKRHSQVIEDIVGRGAVIRGEVARRGINAKAVQVWELRFIEMNPVRLFGFNKKAFSKNMYNRLLPKYAAEKEFAGTLEHVFTQPEMYNFEGLGKLIDVVGADGKMHRVWSSAAYVTKVHEINTEILNLLRKEGVAPENVTQDWWIHRVVEGKFNPEGELIALRGRPGVRGRGRIGAKPSYEMHRKAPTMAEGIAWGIQYNRNPEMAISTYIEEAFNKIANGRLEKYVEEFGVLPAERLAERFPEVVERAALTKTELADAANFGSVINRAIRGEKLPEQTLRAMERRFPELGERLRSLVQEPVRAESQLRELLAQNQKVINDLTRRLKKAEAIDIEAIKSEARAEAVRVGIPDNQKLTEAFKLMDYDDRLAFRNTMDTQLDEIGRVLYEQEGELAGINEFLRTDPVALYHGIIRGKKVPLTAVLKKGQFPESFSVAEAKMLMMGQTPKTIIKGRVPRSVVVDELASHFKMAEQQLIDHIEFIASQRTTATDLRYLINLANSRNKNVRRMLGVLDDVDSGATYVPKPEITPIEGLTTLENATELRKSIGTLAKVERDAEYRSALGYGTEFWDEAIYNQLKAGKSITVFRAAPIEEGEIYLGSRVTHTEASAKAVFEELYLPTEGRILKATAIADDLIPQLPSEFLYVKRTAPIRKVIPKAEPGMPEAGVQKDIFGYETPIFPKGKGQVTQISMEEYGKLADLRKAAGLPGEPPNIAIKPKIEGVKGLEAETQTAKVAYDIPTAKLATERKAALGSLRDEVKAITEARKAPFWKARAERAFRMEQVRQPGIGEGYIMQPFAGGRIYDQAFIDSFNKFFGHEGGLGVLKVTSDLAGILRITKAALDFSAMAIQGLPSFGMAHAYLIFNPTIGARLMGSWYKAFFQSTRAFFDPGVVAGFLTKNKEVAMQRLSFGGSSRAVDYFAALQVRTGVGGKAEWLMEKIPLKPYHRAETSFYAAGEMVRDEFWRILSPKAIARGQEFELARILDRITGIVDPASLGVPLTVRQLEQTFMWFAPSYTRACLTVVADIFRGGMTGAEARKAIGGMITAGAVMYSGVQYAMSITEGKSNNEAWEDVREGFTIYEDPITGEVEWRPSARFMTLRIGNYNFGFGGFWYGLLRLAGNISACVNEIGDREIVDLVRIMKNGSFNKKDNPFIYWWYSRSSPLLGTGFEMASGKDFLGYPIETPEEYLQYIITRFEPIWAEQGLNWLVPGLARDNEIPEGLAREALIPAELFGLRSFPESTWTDFYDKANELIERIPVDELDEKQKEAWKEGKLEWRHLTEMQQANLLSRYPELQELYGEAQADSAVRNSPNWAAYEGRVDEEREIFLKRMREYDRKLDAGEIDTREWRELRKDARSNYAAILDSIERDPNYADIYDFFNKKEAEGDKYGFRDDIMVAEYENNILYAEDLYDAERDFYDWDERDRRVDAFIEKFGEDGFQRILKLIEQKKERKEYTERDIRFGTDSALLSRGYWELPYKPITDMDEEDEAEGNIPAEYYSLWQQYQALDTDAAREAFAKKYPDMARDWRAEYRKDNPEDDARLALWGYGGKLQSMEAYELVTKWGRELGIPLEQMGLGLPPRSLIDRYFEHADIVRETSGGSVEARLYKLENPEWLAWGVENWGWSDLSDENINELTLRRDHKDLFAQYEAYGDRDSDLYIEDAEARDEARDKMLEENPIFRDDRRRVEAYQLDFPDEQIENYVEYSNLPVKGYRRERYLLEHGDFYDSMVDLKDIVPFDPDYKVPDVRYDEIYEEWQDLFEQYDNVTGTTSERAAARERILGANPRFAEARRERQAYGLFVPESLVDEYVAYYSIDRAGYENERYLKEHKEFYRVVWLGILENASINFDNIPSERFEKAYNDIYLKLPKGTERYKYRGENPWFDEEGVSLGKWQPYDPRRGAGLPTIPSWYERLEEQGLLEEWMKKFE